MRVSFFLLGFVCVAFVVGVAGCTPADPVGAEKAVEKTADAGGREVSSPDSGSGEPGVEPSRETTPEPAREPAPEPAPEPGDGSPDAAPPEVPVEEPGAPTKSLSPGQTLWKFTQRVDGKETTREVVVLTPRGGLKGKPTPVVFSFHGRGGNATRAVNFFRRQVDMGLFVLIAPQGLNKAWNLGKEPSRADDVAFVGDILARLREYRDIDLGRVFAHGNSNGAGIVHKMATERAYFRAIAPVVTQLLKGMKPGAGAGLVSVLQISGMQDPLIPYKGGPSRVGHEFTPAEDSSRIWGQHNGCQKEQKSLTQQGDTKIAFTQCKKGTEVLHFGVKNAKHSIPSTFQGGLSRLIWQFFERQKPF